MVMSTHAGQRIKTVLLVVFLTLAIWIYADQSTTDQYEATVVLQPVVPESLDLQVSVGMPEDGRLQFVVTGPRSQIEQFRADQEKRVQDTSRRGWVVPVDPGRSNERTLTRNAIELASEMLSRNYPALTVERCNVDTVTFVIDRYVTMMLPVEVDKAAMDVRVVATDPAQVQVRALESTLNQLEPHQKEQVFVRLPGQIDLTDMDEGRVQREVVVSNTLGGRQVSVKPSTVMVTLDLAVQTTTAELRYQDVTHVFAPQPMWGRYTVELDVQQEFVIYVRGSREIVDSLTTADVVPYVAFTIADEAWDWQTARSRQVSFILPPGVTIDAERTGSLPEVDVKLIATGTVEGAQ